MPTDRVEGPLAPRYLEVTLAMLALVTIVAFEAMAVSTAMPTVARELDAVRSYGLAFSVMLTGQLLGIVLAGVWSDRSGPLVGTFVGQALLAAGSAICGFASGFGMFLAGRALTGLGGGLLVVMLYVIAGRAYPEQIRPRLFTYVSAAWILPSLLGPPLSAWVTETFSWRWVFWGVLLPVDGHDGRAAARRSPGRRVGTAHLGRHPGPRRARQGGLGRCGHRRLRGGDAARHPRAGAHVVAANRHRRRRPRRGHPHRSVARAPRHLADGSGRAERDAVAGRPLGRVRRCHHLRAPIPRGTARQQSAGRRGRARHRLDRVGGRVLVPGPHLRSRSPATSW